MSLILSGVMNIIQLFAVLVCFVVIDNLGRRPLAIWGAVSAACCYIIISGLVGSFSDNWSAHSAGGWVAVAMAFLFMFCYGVSYSPLGWCLPSEVYSTSQRSKGVALATATVWLCNFIVGLITPPMIEGAGFGTYIFFAAWCALAAVWAFFLVPETKRKTLVRILCGLQKPWTIADNVTGGNGRSLRRHQRRDGEGDSQASCDPRSSELRLRRVEEGERCRGREGFCISTSTCISINAYVFQSSTASDIFDAVVVRRL